MEDEPMFEILERPDLVNRMREAVSNVASQLSIQQIWEWEGCEKEKE
jgi:hypothetical protein